MACEEEELIQEKRAALRGQPKTKESKGRGRRKLPPAEEERAKQQEQAEYGAESAKAASEAGADGSGQFAAGQRVLFTDDASAPARQGKTGAIIAAGEHLRRAGDGESGHSSACAVSFLR